MTPAIPIPHTSPQPAPSTRPTDWTVTITPPAEFADLPPVTLTNLSEDLDAGLGFIALIRDIQVYGSRRTRRAEIGPHLATTPQARQKTRTYPLGRGRARHLRQPASPCPTCPITAEDDRLSVTQAEAMGDGRERGLAAARGAEGPERPSR